MVSSLMILQAIVSVLLVLLVLIQFGKGAEAGLLGGADQVMSGPMKGNILVKITTILAFVFLGNSVLLAKLQGKTSTSSLFENEAPIARPLNADQAKRQEKAAKKVKETKASEATKAPVKKETK